MNTTSETRDEEDVYDLTSNSREGKPIVDPNYQLAHDRLRRKIVLPHRYDHAYFIYYALNMVEGLQDLDLYFE